MKNNKPRRSHIYIEKNSAALLEDISARVVGYWVQPMGIMVMILFTDLDVPHTNSHSLYKIEMFISIIIIGCMRQHYPSLFVG